MLAGVFIIFSLVQSFELLGFPCWATCCQGSRLSSYSHSQSLWATSFSRGPRRVLTFSGFRHSDCCQMLDIWVVGCHNAPNILEIVAMQRRQHRNMKPRSRESISGILGISQSLTQHHYTCVFLDQRLQQLSLWVGFHFPQRNTQQYPDLPITKADRKSF